jgi:MFS transporter, ACS family, hexuronate transporter
MSQAPRPIRNLRWWIGGLLFASTVINYIDRQTFSALAPILTREYHWSNSDFATILISFRVAYTIMQSVGGRLLDWLGTRRGLALSVTFYSVVAILTATARGIGSFRVFRFLLGAGEGSNWPGAAKAVAEWFPAKERGWAVALFDSGSAVGGSIAPFIALGAYRYFGTWRPAFLLTGCLGLIWLTVWLRVYRSPEEHPRLDPRELELIRKGRGWHTATDTPCRTGWFGLLRYKQTWGIVLGRFLLDPYWFMVADWFALYLASRGFKLEQSILGFWIPFLGADLGNFFGGGLSSYWIRKGWPVGRARRTVILVFGPSMLALIPCAYTNNYALLVLLFGYASFAYAACSTIFLAMPADAFHPSVVATVSGMGGTGAGIGTLISTFLIGYTADRFSFAPVVIAASIVPCIATIALVTLVRAPKTPDPAGVAVDF